MAGVEEAAKVWHEASLHRPMEVIVRQRIDLKDDESAAASLDVAVGELKSS
jgi:hypothetical protein